MNIENTMNIENVCYLPSGRVFLSKLSDGYLIESTEMRDVAVDGKLHMEVRNSLDPHVIWNHLVPYSKKWLLTVSTQRGCTHNCKFCDVAPLKFCGNLSCSEICDQVKLLLENTPYVQKCDKVKIGFARMGEPAHNVHNVLEAMKFLPELSAMMKRDFNWLPCFNSILPRKTVQGISGFEVIDQVIQTKEEDFNGRLHFQISCNSTNEDKRRELFGGADVLSLDETIAYIRKKSISNRTVTLNFIVMDGVEVSVDKLQKMGLNGNQFAVKLIPLNKTNNSIDNDLKTYANYDSYDKLVSLANEFKRAGIPVIYDAIAKCEEAGLCCGQLAQIFTNNKGNC